MSAPEWKDLRREDLGETARKLVCPQTQWQA